MGRIEVGEKCDKTGGEIKKIFAIVKKSSVKGYENHYVHNGESLVYVDLSSKNIDFAKFEGYWCEIWGDFWDKNTRTGKIKRKFLVLRIERRYERGSNGKN